MRQRRDAAGIVDLRDDLVGRRPFRGDEPGAPRDSHVSNASLVDFT
jgi:hypothetical protein